MLMAGFRSLARALPGVLPLGNLGALLTGGTPAPPHRKAPSFPKQVHESAPPGQKPDEEG
jgi:hypothetical protein